MEFASIFLMSSASLWSQFTIAALLIVFAGFKLIKYGDIISQRLNLGHAFVGAVLIGWSTSLPELILSIGTAGIEKEPLIAMGNVLGSNLFNLWIIVLLDIVYWKGPILRKNPKLILSAALSILMAILVGVAISLRHSGQVSALAMGFDSLIVIGVYFICMGILYKTDQSSSEEEPQSETVDISTASLTIKCVLVIALVVGAGLWLSKLSTKIPELYPNLSKGFVGTMFLAIVSSLPEVITGFAAVRMGFHNMALGTLFGSNIFNMAIIAFCDIFYRQGNIFSTATNVEQYAPFISSVVFIVIITAIAIFVLGFSKKERKGWFIGIESILICILYLIAVYINYNPKILTDFLCK